jgi:7-carboxy-7-deazaguanine synthase
MAKPSMKRELMINEIFFSLQGESTLAGLPCLFVRTMGCPLRCTYCDTEYAFHEGQKMSFEDIFAALDQHPSCKLVEITGGEPLAQKSTVLLMDELVNRGMTVMIETSGAFSLAQVPPTVRIIMDVKAPSSNETARMNWDNMAHLKAGRDEVKFVLSNFDDFKFATQVCQSHKLFERGLTVLASPRNATKTSPDFLPYSDLSKWILKSGMPFRFQAQLHKHIWGDKRGV